MPNRPTFIDLFSGCGGFTLGMLRAGLDCKAAIDFNSPCNVHELRQSYGYLEKAFGQLSRFRGCMEHREFREAFGRKCGLDLVVAPPLTTCVVMGNQEKTSLRSFAQRTTRGVRFLAVFAEEIPRYVQVDRGIRHPKRTRQT